MKIYIAGKITGDKDYRTKFLKAEEKIRNMGHSVMNPAWILESPEFDWEDYMKVSGAMQKVCNAVLLLPDWKQSRGAKKEYESAMYLGQPVYFSIEEIAREEDLELTEGNKCLQEQKTEQAGASTLTIRKTT